MSEETVVRRRSRAVLGGVSDELRDQVAHVFELNKQMNATKGAYEKARKVLLEQMDTEKQTFVTSEIELDGKKLNLAAEVSTPTSVGVDVAKLREAVTEEQFLAMVSATKSAVVDNVGTLIFTKCSVPKTGTRNVSVSSQKQG